MGLSFLNEEEIKDLYCNKRTSIKETNERIRKKEQIEKIVNPTLTFYIHFKSKIIIIIII
jgi:hypothetical protein